jgi:hypothetical protein
MSPTDTSGVTEAAEAALETRGLILVLLITPAAKFPFTVVVDVPAVEPMLMLVLPPVEPVPILMVLVATELAPVPMLMVCASVERPRVIIPVPVAPPIVNVPELCDVPISMLVVVPDIVTVDEKVCAAENVCAIPKPARVAVLLGKVIVVLALGNAIVPPLVLIVSVLVELFTPVPP